jgi:sulfur carrier protein
VNTCVQITVNGQSRQVPDGTTLAALLEQLGLAGKPLAVEVNLQLIPRQQHGKHLLKAGDRVEIVTLVGGG